MSIGKRDGGASTSKESHVSEPASVAVATAATSPVIVAAPIGYVTVDT